MPEWRHEIDLGEGIAELVAVALGHAAGDHQAGTLGAGFGRCEDRVN